MMRLPSPPGLNAGETAFFLDFDGTLVVFDRPDLKKPEVDADLRGLIQGLHRASSGATAVITGRTIEDLDGMFHPDQLNASGEHGAEWRMNGHTGQIDVPPALDEMTERCAALMESLVGCYLERKRFSLVMHLHERPELRDEIAEQVGRHCAPEGGLKVLLANGMVEVKPIEISKGHAVSNFMQRPPYAGRKPVFIGDDVTDEDGFRAVNALSGISIKVGPGPTQAQYRLENPAAVLAWLRAFV